MAQLQLRPHSVGGIIDASFTVFRRRYGSMIAAAFMLTVIPFVVEVIGGCTMKGGNPSCSTTGWFGYAAFQVAVVLATAGNTLVAVEAYAGLSSGWRRSAGAGLRYAYPIIVASLMAYIGIGLGFLVFIVPGIFLLASWAVFQPALVIEQLRPTDSLRRSWRLAKEERWRLVGAGFAMLIIGIIGFSIIGAIVWGILYWPLGLSGEAASLYAQQIVTVLSVPLSAAVAAVLYVDLRVRKEHLDSDQLIALLSRTD